MSGVVSIELVSHTLHRGWNDVTLFEGKRTCVSLIALDMQTHFEVSCLISKWNVATRFSGRVLNVLRET